MPASKRSIAITASTQHTLKNEMMMISRKLVSSEQQQMAALKLLLPWLLLIISMSCTWTTTSASSSHRYRPDRQQLAGEASSVQQFASSSEVLPKRQLLQQRADSSSGRVNNRLIRRCGTNTKPLNAVPMMKALNRDMQMASSASANDEPFNETVPVVFHVIHDGETGKVPEHQLQAQMAVINQAFNGSGFSFQLLSINYTNNPTWFRIINSTYNDDDVDENGRVRNNPPPLPMKAALRFGGAEVLNVYTVYMRDLLGYAPLPFFTLNKRSSPNWKFVRDGIVLNFESLPGGAKIDFNLGHTLTHEIGHWLALFHTFDGGCVQGNRGDFISDTPAEGEPNTDGCDTNRDTCSAARFPGKDPVENFMDYSADACYRSFTPMQIVRMRMAWTRYRKPNQ